MTEAPEGIPGELKDLHRLIMLRTAISFFYCALSRHQTPRVILMAFALRWCAAGRSALSEPVERYARMLLMKSKVRLLPCTSSILVHSLFRASSAQYPHLKSANFEHLRMPYLPPHRPSPPCIAPHRPASLHTALHRPTLPFIAPHRPASPHSTLLRPAPPCVALGHLTSP